jgi:23S rRNA pseudouridine2605 synthase
MLERLQKIIARAGIASRRHAEELIASGMVTVNGQTVTELGSKADETKDHIKVQGKLLQPETERAYLILNKPPEVVSTMVDPEGRRCLRDLLHGISLRVFPVGRLEYHSMGLVFLTNDGELANLMLKAHYLPQTYNLKLKTLLTFEEVESLSRLTGAHIVRIKGKDSPWYEVTLSEARRDELRNRLFQTGHPVEKIKRIKIGNIAMESLTPGAHRPLSEAEVATLRRMIDPKNAAQAVAASTGPIQEKLGPKAVNLSPAQFTTERRPFLKKRPYQPKPKPGERPAQNAPMQEVDGNRFSVPPPPRQANAGFSAGASRNQFRPNSKPFGKPNMDRPSRGPREFSGPPSGGHSSGAPRPGFGSKPSGRPPFRSNERPADRQNDRPYSKPHSGAPGGSGRPPFRSGDRPNDRPYSRPQGGAPSGGRPPFRSNDRPYAKSYSSTSGGSGRPPFKPGPGSYAKGKPGGIDHGRREFMGNKAGTPQSGAVDAPAKPPRSFPSRTEGSAKWGPNERVFHKPSAEELERPAKSEFPEVPSRPKSDRPWQKKQGAGAGGFDRPRPSFKPRSSAGHAPAGRSENRERPDRSFSDARPAAAGRSNFASKPGRPSGPRPGAPFRGKSSSEPGAFGRGNKTSRSKPAGRPSKPFGAGKAGGGKPGAGGKRAPSGARPRSKPGGFSKPKGRR